MKIADMPFVVVLTGVGQQESHSESLSRSARKTGAAFRKLVRAPTTKHTRFEALTPMGTRGSSRDDESVAPSTLGVVGVVVDMVDAHGNVMVTLPRASQTILSAALRLRRACVGIAR